MVGSTGNIGIGVSPTAALHLKAGTTTANTAPLKFTSSAGAVLGTPEAGAVEYDGTNYFVSNAGIRYTLAKTLTNTATLDFPATGGNTSQELFITVNGAEDGDVVALGIPNSATLANTTYTARVSSANTVAVRFNNYINGGSVDPSSGTFRVSVFKY